MSEKTVTFNLTLPMNFGKLAVEIRNAWVDDNQVNYGDGLYLNGYNLYDSNKSLYNKLIKKHGDYIDDQIDWRFPKQGDLWILNNQIIKFDSNRFENGEYNIQIGQLIANNFYNNWFVYSISSKALLAFGATDYIEYPVEMQYDHKEKFNLMTRKERIEFVQKHYTFYAKPEKPTEKIGGFRI